MKNPTEAPEKSPQRTITRREFVGGALATGVLVAGAPALLRGRNLNDRLNIAFIGSGGRANTNLRELTMLPGQKPPDGPADPHAGPHPDENVTVLCDVSQPALDAASAKFPKAKTYTDLRKIFDSPNDFDAVVVSTAESTHAVATYLALTHGKHVYCEKPLTYNIWEARLIRETAAKYPKLSTQMGNQGHALPIRRVIKEILDTGVIGKVSEVHVWVDRAWGLQDAASAEKFDKAHGFYKGIQIVERFKEEMPIPEGNHFDLWIGPAPARPFHETYFPGPRWYRWWDFGNGTMSDLGSHDNDVPYTVLDIKQPLTIEATSPNGKPDLELAPATMTAVYEFPGVKGAPPVKLVWHQGQSKPPGWVPEWGNRSQLFIGDKGMLLGNGKLLPEEKFTDFKMPEPTLPRSPGHWVEWVNYAKGKGPVPGSNFQYSGWTTEANHLGNVAYRTGKRIEWDYENMRVKNAPEADKFIKREYRKGWEGILKT
jgi:predicted dehydrogenase